MNKKYNEIYEDLFERMSFDYDYFYFQSRFRHRHIFDYHRSVFNSIREADPNNNLRPDAKYFLQVNFVHLVILPILIEKENVKNESNENNEIDFHEKLISNIKSDIRSIISESKQSEKEKTISGHSIMNAINNIWGKLETTKMEIWGE